MNQSTNRQLIVTTGLPGSGKSTWAKAWVIEDYKARVRINRDDIRRMLGPYWVPEREDLVTIIERRMAIDALEHNYSIVVDATNFKANYWQGLAQQKGVQYRLKSFTDVPLEECIRRDKLREHSVGEKVIMMMHEKYLSHKLTQRPKNITEI